MGFFQHNSVEVIGNVTHDPVLHEGNFAPFITLSVAVHERVGTKEEPRVKAHFFNVTYNGEDATKLQKIATKGTKVMVSGSLRDNRWEKDGAKHRDVKIAAKRISIIARPRRTTATEPTPE